jgi:hypothetical protein
MSVLEARSDSMKRKFPRLFLANRESGPPLPDVFLIWPDRTQAQILDLSESGILVSALGSLGQVKLGQVLDVRLRIGGKDPKPVSVKVLRLTGHSILLALDSLTLNGRLKMEQEDRENLIRSSWRRLSCLSLHPTFHDCDWWHSVFDTNIFIWRDSAAVPTRVIVEFESVALVYDSQGTRFLRAPSAFDEAKGYAGPFSDPLPNKVEPGHNWTERLKKVLGASLPPSVIGEVLAHV